MASSWGFLFLLLPDIVAAQAGTELPLPPPPSAGYLLDPKVRVSPSMAIVLVCLVSSFFLMGCISVYARNCADRHRALHAGESFGSVIRPRQTSGRGLNHSIMDTFPTFIYSDVKGLNLGKSNLECAVCLNEYEDEDTLRLIPKCSHVFHYGCINAWLASHVTCPVCRSNLVTKPVEQAVYPAPSRDSNNIVHGSVRTVDNSDLIEQSPELMTNHIRPVQLQEAIRYLPQSHLTSESVVQSGKNMERFMLQLPQEVRNRLVNIGLTRAKSCGPFERIRSLRKGYRSFSIGSGRGRSCIHYEQFDYEGQLDRRVMTPNRPFFSRIGLTRSPRVDGSSSNDLMVTTRMNLLRSVKSPQDHLFERIDKDNIGERSSDRLRSDTFA